MNQIALNLVSFSFFTSVEWFSRTALRSSRNSFLKIHSCEYAMTTTVRPFRFLFKPVQVRTDRKFYQTSHTIEAFEASQTSNNSRNATVRTVSVEILPDWGKQLVAPLHFKLAQHRKCILSEAFVMLRSWLLVISLFCVVIHAQTVADRPRISLEESHNAFNARKHRKHDERRSKLKRQDIKQKNAQHRHELLNMEYAINGSRFCRNSLAPPHSQLSVRAITVESTPVVMTAAESAGKAQCSYLGAVCSTERTEHLLVNKYILPADSVLEVRLSVHIHKLARSFEV
jgi:hypothetical protein